MRDNITKVAERGERLDQLQDKTGTLSVLLLSHDCVAMALVGLFGHCEELVLFMCYDR